MPRRRIPDSEKRLRGTLHAPRPKPPPRVYDGDAPLTDDQELLLRAMATIEDPAVMVHGDRLAHAIGRDAVAQLGQAPSRAAATPAGVAYSWLRLPEPRPPARQV